MKLRQLVFVLFAMGLAACDHAPGSNPAKPESYAVRLPLEPAQGGALQRLTLPPAALVVLRRADLGDVRLFDARERVVPLALLENVAKETQHGVSVPIYPVAGLTGARQGSGLSIRIEDNRIAKIVTVDSSAPATGNVAALPAALLDTHALQEPAIAIALDIDVPAGQPITLTLQTSANLKDWEPLAEKVIFRPAESASLIGGTKVALPGTDLHGRYVGISWTHASGIAIKRANVITAMATPPARVAVATSAVPMSDAHDLRFDLPQLARLTSIRVTETGADGVIPVKLFGRRHAEDPWILLSAATLQSGPPGAELDLNGPAMPSYRLEADSRTAGFSSAPKLELLLEPVDLLLALGGTPPYRLAAGQAAAPGAYLTLREILPQDNPPKLEDLPRARLVSPGAPSVVTLGAGAKEGALQPRKLALWTALLLGTLVLALAAIRLLRGTVSLPDGGDV